VLGSATVSGGSAASARRLAALLESVRGPVAGSDAAERAPSGRGRVVVVARALGAFFSAARSSLSAAAAAATAALTGTRASPSTSPSVASAAAAIRDALPSRGLDSRVVSINAVPAGGSSPLRVRSAAAPFLITLPLRDLSIVEWDGARSVAPAVDIGQKALAGPVINVTCPATPGDAAARGVAAR
jgi:hypothetical protein